MLDVPVPGVLSRKAIPVLRQKNQATPVIMDCVLAVQPVFALMPVLTRINQQARILQAGPAIGIARFPALLRAGQEPAVLQARLMTPMFALLTLAPRAGLPTQRWQTILPAPPTMFAVPAFAGRRFAATTEIAVPAMFAKTRAPATPPACEALVLQTRTVMTAIPAPAMFAITPASPILPAPTRLIAPLPTRPAAAQLVPTATILTHGITPAKPSG